MTGTEVQRRERRGRHGAWVGAASLGIVLLAAGCASGHPAAPPRAAPPPSPERRAEAARYLAIAVAGNRRLEIDFDRLAGPDRGRLAAAQADLRDAADTERLFDRRLLALTFPPQTEAVARRLATVNEARAELTTTAADVTTLPLLRQYEARLTAANVPVEDAVTTIRSQLGLPPPSTS
ncbi:hypothetical protein ABIA32_000552 [Streptacidiphilus sp. MAP12-20]|uniref:hypothetical protein n=1 Tax=Streptacidiphilus sp. MAP12-20 TaxID=3156299 RepID=UPI003516B5CE